MAADEVVRRNLDGTGWIFSAQTAISRVIEKHSYLTRDEYTELSQGTFDFIVCREEDHEVEFAIEFDGPSHDDPRQIERDVIKNRLCAEAGLPLLRIRRGELREREQITVLDWLLELFITWESETPDAAEELIEDLEASPGGESIAQEPEEVVGILAATFGCEFPFPANAEIAKRLYRRFGISLGERLDDYEPDAKAPYVLEVDWPGKHHFEETKASAFIVCERQARMRDRAKPGSERFTTKGRAHFAAEHRIGPGPKDFRPPELPWLQSEWIVMDLALYHALVQVEHWAGLNLRDMGLGAS
jgi:uncharacterized protein DUF2726